MSNIIQHDGHNNEHAVPTKDEFRALVARISLALTQIDAVYPRMIDTARAFDKELARRLEAAMKADREVFEYVKSKAEAGEALPPGVLAGLLG